MQKFDFSVLWKHYSSYFLTAILALGTCWDYVPAVKEYIPRWLIIVLAVGGLVSKTYKQQLKENQCPSEKPPA